MILLSVDPSINSPGVALFRDGVLIAAGNPRPGIHVGANEATRCMHVADAVVTWAAMHTECVDQIAHEWPQVYAEGKGKGNPNGLLPMVGVNLAIDMLIRERMRQSGVELVVTSYLPATWIGQLPKVCSKCHGRASKRCALCSGSAKRTPRGVRIMSRLSPAEALLVPDQHDVIDGLGIGLFHLGRLAPRRVYTTG